MAQLERLVVNYTDPRTATIAAHSQCGPIQLTTLRFLEDPAGLGEVDGRSFRPESVVYHPLNSAAAGNLILPLAHRSGQIEAVAVTFLNNTDHDAGEVNLFVSLSHPASPAPVSRTASLSSGDSITYHVIFIPS